MERRVVPRVSVSDFLAIANQVLEASLGPMEIEGEVASFKINQQKYVFFDLKDESGTISCFMMAWQLRLAVEDGMRVVVRATPKLTAWGKFSLTVQSITPVGEGQLRRSFELLKRRLAAEGLFDDSRKRPLPRLPGRVAVISSLQAAGYADFMKIAAERWGGGRFVVFPVAVQGAGAADQMIAALERAQQLAELPEVIVLIRGGGSADDLSAFNDELLVRAVAASRVPVLTGIGHETDESLCDLAADVRAATPSNAAQLLLLDKHEVLRTVQLQVQTAGAVVQRAAQQVLEQVQAVSTQALAAWRSRVDGELDRLQLMQARIAEYDPALALRRGYAMIEGALEVGQVVRIITETAQLRAKIIERQARKEKGEG